ncbi:NupC/NupG family nucleoside CNT transporter [Bombilactobacillus thymidiniphilus]|uniref:NupC/NupG family nucleoside CNT transporter n=1 Tax=Bombilactobacillus thymidiniphilus TaxID=2923363 RepID=A0ABY4PED5_9LACO|nr:nucleoside transporter C-terminal domain-containing protein [Bombilactobacillus thymidiniphilus]UQS83925.1 NupC/NupG family nucleoside CNT transporter [Bombilactobacillus thymidiniphilus]
MFLAINILGLLVFIAVAYLFSKNRKAIHWRSILVMLVINLVIAGFLTIFPIGRTIVSGAAAGFNALVQVAYTGIAFAVPSMVHVKKMDFLISVLMPILLIVPLFDILTYIGFLPWAIKWIGRGLAKITGQPKFESFFSVEMMFLGNTEALAVSGLQLNKMTKERNLTVAMMSMSCITASIVGAYTKLVPGQYVLTAIPVNIINAIIVTNILNPVSVQPEDDVIATMKDDDQSEEREPFFSFLGDSIAASGKLILIIFANVVAFVALAALADKILGLIHPWLSLEHILGIVMFPFAWLMGLNPSDAFQLAQYMGTKLVTNEFVVMGDIAKSIRSFAPHYQAVITVFLTSFANLSTIGMIIGAYKDLVDREKNNYIAKNIGLLLISGILVSLMSAATVGLFVW